MRLECQSTIRFMTNTAAIAVIARLLHLAAVIHHLF